jgi:hypothetical protein
MEEIAARASLVPAADVGQGLTTSVSRSEIEDVLASEEKPIQLVLEITRFSDGEAGEMRSVAVSWERTDLEQLLKEAQGDNVVLTFDREALRQAVESDVDAHGMREKLLVLAVAATAATGAAASAAAEPGPYLGARSAGAESTLASDDRAVSRAAPTTVPDSTMGVDDRAVPRAAPTPEPVRRPGGATGRSGRNAERGARRPGGATGRSGRNAERGARRPGGTSGDAGCSSWSRSRSGRPGSTSGHHAG